jgi:hypothetical protein
VIPADVQLTSLAGNVASGVGAAGGGGVGLRSGIAGPALEMVGCTTSQASVAAFIEALKSIDGVTRVGFQGSSMGGGTSATAAGSCESGGAQFQLVAAFDAAPVVNVEEGGAVAPEATTPEASAESGAETTSSESSEAEAETSESSSTPTETVEAS